MPLPPGTRLGQYDVLAALGAGGMGEVYRARDTKLGRDVALKILPESVVQDAERLSRFRREAQILAALNHPHIGGIHGFEEAGGHQFLVLELIDGETLAARLERGAIPVNEALDIAREIAAALEAAHDKGIVHRDLKPSNIAFSGEGTAKVLDFGLAKSMAGSAAELDPNVLNSPTITSPLTLTGMGVILGTAAYMSPEQAKGAVADKRADVWAFGCVLYEMLTGRRAFPGDDVTDILAAVIRSQPDVTVLPESLSPAVRRLLEGCLEKDRRKRIADLSVARFVLDGRSALTDTAARNRPARPAWRLALLLLGGVGIGAAAHEWWGREAPTPLPITRFTEPLPEGVALVLVRRAVTISPDGSRIAYSASDGRLFIRSMGELGARPLVIADVALHPTFSPDGQSIAFWADGALKRVSVTGGTPVKICDISPAPFSVTWTEHGIVFSGGQARGIVRVSPQDASSEVLFARNDADGLPHAAQLLPDGDTLLFAIGRVTSTLTNFWDGAQIVAQSIRTGRRTVLVEGGSTPTYLRTGHIVYAVEGTLMAVAFDPATLAVTGAHVPVIEGVRRSGSTAGGEAQFAVSDAGTLVYVPGPARTGHEDVILYGKDKTATSLNLPKGRYAFPRASPDGLWLALETRDVKDSTISVYRLSGTDALRRLTFGGNNRVPIWSRDSTRVVFQSDREGDAGIFWQPLDGGAPERLTSAEGGTTHVPESWSPTDDVFLYSVTRGSASELWTFSVRERKASRFGDVESAVPTNAVFHPGGRWVAYQSGEPGRGEATTYVQPFPPTGAKYQIARGGRPIWSPDGRQLFFIPTAGQLAVVNVTMDKSFANTAPAPYPRLFGISPPASPRNYDILPDGRIVGINTAGEAENSVVQINVVQNWFEELKARVPVPR